jgi:hypothetical protein
VSLILNTSVTPATTPGDVTPENSPKAAEKKDKKKKKDKDKDKKKDKENKEKSESKPSIVEENKPPDFIANGFAKPKEEIVEIGLFHRLKCDIKASDDMIKNRYLEVTEEIIRSHIFRVKFNFIAKRKEEWEEDLIQKHN